LYRETPSELERLVFRWLVASWLVLSIIQSVCLGILGLWVVARLIWRLSI